MPASLLCILLAAAFLHAAWNCIIKGGNNKHYETGLITTGSFLAGICCLPFIPTPVLASWPYLCLSCLCHTGYYLCLASAYEKTDLTVGYTVMRGVAPLLTSLALLLLGERLPGIAWVGVCILCLGILSLAFEAQHHIGTHQGLTTSLATAAVIAAYTLTDGLGARRNGDAVSYVCWLFVLKMLPMQAWLLWRHGSNYTRYARTRPWPGILGGLACFGSYGIAIWAMTMAPIAVVAALRETSVVFGMLVAVFWLHEPFTLVRGLAVLLVAGGAILLNLK